MQARKGLLRITAGGATVVVMVMVIGLITESYLSAREARQFPAPGRLIEVQGGRRLHLRCIGEGSPTVLAEMGAGGWGLYWTDIQNALAKVTRTCLYDRAGYGWSDDGPKPRTSERLLGDLEEVLRQNGEPGPFILAGHSLGGWLIRLYQARHPREVAGLALVESAHPSQWTEFPPEIWEFTRSSAKTLRVFGALGRFGTLRLLAGVVARQELGDSLAPAYGATAIRPSAMTTLASEIVNSEPIAEEVSQLGGVGDLPVVVVSAGRSIDAFRSIASDWPFEEAEVVWDSLQRDLLSISTTSWQRISPHATHNIHTDDPALVVSALIELVDSVRVRSRPSRWAQGRIP